MISMLDSSRPASFLPAGLITALLFLGGCSRALAPVDSVEVASKGMHTAAIDEAAELTLVGSIYHGGSLWRLGDSERLFDWNHTQTDYSTFIAADFSDDGAWAVSAEAHTMVLWNTRNGEGSRYWTAPAEILDIELNQNASLALLGLSDHTAVAFDIQRGGIRQTFTHKNRVRSVDFSADGRLAISGSEDYTARVWDVRSGALLSTMQHEDDVQLVVLSDDAQLALSVSKYDTARLWNPASGELIAELPLRAEHLKRGLRFTTARFSKNNQLLLTGRADQIVQLWDVETMKEVGRWKLPKRDAWKPTSAAVLDVAFSEREGIYYAAASNGFIHTLNAAQ